MLLGPRKVVECLLCAAILAILVGGDRLFVSAQYNYNMRNRYNAGHYAGYGASQQEMRPEGAQMEEEMEEDERPRINFGIRLRVPAMKLELPRFNLPKITVTAKIRQPDGPRVIKLPAINLDTSSRVETPSSAAERPINQQAAFHQHQQPSKDYRGFDDDNMNDVQHYGRFPNSPANRLKQQQQQQQSGYYQRQNLANSNYAAAATNYYPTDAYQAASPQNYRHSRNRFY